MESLDLVSVIRQSEGSQGYDKWVPRPPHGVTSSGPHNPATTHKSSCASLCRKPSACSVCMTHSIVLIPRISLHNASDSCGHSTVLAGVQGTGHPRHWPFKKSKSPKYPWPTNHLSLPAHVATQTARRVLWPAHRLLVISGLWCIMCDLIKSTDLCCSLLFWLLHIKAKVVVSATHKQLFICY